MDVCLLFATFCHRLHRLDPVLPLFSRGSLQEIMNLIRSDYLKEVAVSTVLFGCMKTKRKEKHLSWRNPANGTSAGAVWRTMAGGRKRHAACLSCDNSSAYRRARNLQLWPQNHEEGWNQVDHHHSDMKGSRALNTDVLTYCHQSWRVLPLRGRSNAWKRGCPSVWTSAPSSFLSCDPTREQIPLAVRFSWLQQFREGQSYLGKCDLL